MDENRIMITLRDMAWERAKGELESMKSTFWGGKSGSSEEFYQEFCDVIANFIDKMENELGI